MCSLNGLRAPLACSLGRGAYLGPSVSELRSAKSQAAGDRRELLSSPQAVGSEALGEQPPQVWSTRLKAGLIRIALR